MKGGLECQMMCENLDRFLLRPSLHNAHPEVDPELMRLLEFEMPPVVYDMRLYEEFKQELERLKAAHPMKEALNWEGYFVRQEERQEEGMVRIPLLPYNYTFKTSEQGVRPWFMDVCDTVCT